MYNKTSKSYNNHFHKGFYENDVESIKTQLGKIKSINSAEIFKNGDCVYYEANIFLHGICHIFAYVLHQKFGYDILEVKNKSGSMIHWCCITKHNGRKLYIDVRGMTTDYDEFLSEFQPDIGLKPLKNKIINLENYEDEWKETDQLQFASEIITKYYSYYSLSENN